MEKSYQGAPQGDLDLGVVNNLLGGAITQLQNKVDDLNEKIKKLEVKEVKS